MIDLHIHTTASDGTFSPCDVVHMAHDAGVSAIAITDHDTVEGIDAGIECAATLPIRCIPGIEVSANLPRSESVMHVVGLFIDHTNAFLIETINRLIAMREERNPQIVEKLRSLGIDITYAEVQREATSNVVSRPHIARVLVRKGIVKNMGQAFARYLSSNGGKAAVAKRRLSAADAISLIHRAGGVSILAHPDQLNMKPAGLRYLLNELKEMGLDGMECHCAAYPPTQTAMFLRLCKEFNLLPSGGSDFHGTGKASSIGTGCGHMQVPETYLLALEKSSQLYRPSQ